MLSPPKTPGIRNCCGAYLNRNDSIENPPLPVPLLHPMEEREENICSFDSPFGEALTGTFVPSPPLGAPGAPGGEVGPLFNCIVTA